MADIKEAYDIMQNYQKEATKKTRKAEGILNDYAHIIGEAKRRKIQIDGRHDDKLKRAKEYLVDASTSYINLSNIEKGLIEIDEESKTKRHRANIRHYNQAREGIQEKIASINKQLGLPSDDGYTTTEKPREKSYTKTVEEKSISPEDRRLNNKLHGLHKLILKKYGNSRSKPTASYSKENGIEIDFTPSEIEKSELEVILGKERILPVLSIVAFTFALIFSSFSITGNIVKDATSPTANYIALACFLTGAAIALLYLKKIVKHNKELTSKKKPKKKSSKKKK